MSSSPSGTFAAVQPITRTQHHAENIERSLEQIRTALHECRERTRETRAMLQRMNQRSWDKDA